jgi:hypothetical protein
MSPCVNFVLGRRRVLEAQVTIGARQLKDTLDHSRARPDRQRHGVLHADSL